MSKFLWSLNAAFAKNCWFPNITWTAGSLTFIPRRAKSVIVQGSIPRDLRQKSDHSPLYSPLCFPSIVKVCCPKKDKSLGDHFHPPPVPSDSLSAWDLELLGCWDCGSLKFTGPWPHCWPPPPPTEQTCRHARTYAHTHTHPCRRIYKCINRSNETQLDYRLEPSTLSLHGPAPLTTASTAAASVYTHSDQRITLDEAWLKEDVQGLKVLW